MCMGGRGRATHAVALYAGNAANTDCGFKYFQSFEITWCAYIGISYMYNIHTHTQTHYSGVVRIWPYFLYNTLCENIHLNRIQVEMYKICKLIQNSLFNL